jgi:hypothetical protein
MNSNNIAANAADINTNQLPWAQNRHLIHQALFVGSTSTSVGSSLWKRDNGWGMQKVCPQWVLAWTSANPVQLLCTKQHNSQKLSTNPLPWAQNRHLIHQALFVGSTSTSVGSSLWQRDMQKVCLMGSGLDFSINLVQLLCNITARQSAPTHSHSWHRIGISSIKHCLLGPQAQVWEVLYGRGTIVGSCRRFA